MKLRRSSLVAVLLAGLVLTACQGGLFAAPTATFAPSPTPLPSATATARPTPTVTPLPSPSPSPTAIASTFDGERAFADVEHQVALGPRVPGSEAHDAIVAWMQAELQAAGWEVEVQESQYNDHTVRNVIAKRGTGQQPWILLGAHYDSRMEASQDPDLERRKDPVPGANDGGSGVAVLLELARVLPADLDKDIWLTFFDVEDQGGLPGWEWIIGSTRVAEAVAALPRQPDAVVIVDMVGDANLNLPMERNSDPALVQEIWSTAQELGYSDLFLQQPGYAMLDDHTPFLARQMRAVDIIDFDYPEWHTTADTPDKVSAASLKAVGDTLYHWLHKKR